MTNLQSKYFYSELWIAQHIHIVIKIIINPKICRTYFNDDMINGLDKNVLISKLLTYSLNESV